MVVILYTQGPPNVNFGSVLGLLFNADAADESGLTMIIIDGLFNTDDSFLSLLFVYQLLVLVCCNIIECNSN